MPHRLIHLKTLALAALLFLLTNTAEAQQLAITWDNLPSHKTLPPGKTRIQIANDIIAAMQAAKLPPVYGFLNGSRLEKEPESIGVLDAWRTAGNLLGNHGW